MEKEIQLLIDAIRKCNSRFDVVDYALFKKRDRE